MVKGHFYVVLRGKLGEPIHPRPNRFDGKRVVCIELSAKGRQIQDEIMREEAK